MSDDETNHSAQLTPSTGTGGGSGGSESDPNFHGASPFPKKYVPGQKPTRMLEWFEILVNATEERVGTYAELSNSRSIYQQTNREAGLRLDLKLEMLDESIAVMLSPLLAKHNVPKNRHNEVAARLMLLVPKTAGMDARQSIDALIALYQQD